MLPVKSGNPFPSTSLSSDLLTTPGMAPTAAASAISSVPQIPKRLYPQKEPRDSPTLKIV